MDLKNGDCLELMKQMDNDSVDLLFCDLPYGQTSCKWDCVIDLDLFWKQVKRICKDDAPMVFTCSVKFGNTLINSNPKMFRYDLVWVKSSACGFLNAKKMPMKKHEMVYVFYKKLPKVYTDNIAEHHTHKFLRDPPLPSSIIKEGIKGNTYNTEHRKKPIIRSTPNQYDPPLPNSVVKEDDKPLYDCEYNSTLYGSELKRDDRKNKIIYDPPLPNTILEVKSEKGKHSTQKPVQLMKWILKYYSREGSVVLDPTMGSGSMGVACKEMNRQFIGMEMNEDIFKVAVERLM